MFFSDDSNMRKKIIFILTFIRIHLVQSLFGEEDTELW
jgi:hypothetical protein